MSEWVVSHSWSLLYFLFLYHSGWCSVWVEGRTQSRVCCQHQRYIDSRIFHSLHTRSHCWPHQVLKAESQLSFLSWQRPPSLCKCQAGGIAEWIGEWKKQAESWDLHLRQRAKGIEQSACICFSVFRSRPAINHRKVGETRWFSRVGLRALSNQPTISHHSIGKKLQKTSNPLPWSQSSQSSQ
jgi:hypothetical protein